MVQDEQSSSFLEVLAKARAEKDKLHGPTQDAILFDTEQPLRQLFLPDTLTTFTRGTPMLIGRRFNGVETVVVLDPTKTT